MEAEEKYILDMQVPGRFVVYPPSIPREEAEKVLLTPCSKPTNYCRDLGITTIGVMNMISNENSDTLNQNPYNYRFELSDFPDGSGKSFAFWHTIEPEYQEYLNATTKLIKNWFINYEKQISPQFLEIREEVKRYIEDFRVYPMPGGFVEWFISRKIGGLKIELKLPFDENGILINGGEGLIKYDFHDLWKIADTRITSDYIYEYTEFRQKEEDTKAIRRKILTKQNEVDLRVVTSNTSKTKLTVVRNKTLKSVFDIWEEDTDSEDTKSYYNEVIQSLITNDYIQKINECFQWRKQRHGHISYCAGFLTTCINKGWIKDVYTSTELVEAMNISFNVGIKSNTSFKPEALHTLQEKYLKPFQSMRLNSK